MLERQWCLKASKAVEHRKDWKTGVVDFHLFSQIASRRSYRDVWILRTAASGKHYTNDIISKYTNGVQKTCPFCDKQDGKKHRLWSCCAFKDIRAKYLPTLQKVQSQKSNLGLYALPPMQDPIFACLPGPSIVPATTSIPSDDHNFRYLFLDGTAFGQEYRDLTVSAWAVVEADFNQHNFHTCDKNFVPGHDQNSYRGEVVAILRGLETIFQGIMYTDCAAALTIFMKLQQAVIAGQAFPQVDHQDLWVLVWQHLCHRPKECIKLVKVKAHQDVSTITDHHEHWLAAGNNFVDLEAKSVVLQHSIHKQVCEAAKCRKQLAQLTSSYYDYVCEVADRSFQLTVHKRRCARHEAEQQMERPNFDMLLPRQVHEPSAMLQWDDLPCYCPYGEVFYKRFAEWFSTLRWPVSFPQGVMSYVSLLELYFNYVVCTGTETPISTANRGKPANYRLLDQDMLLQAKSWSLSQHTRVWCLFWGWCLKHNVFSNPPTKTCNHYLEHVGYSMQSVCLVGRPFLTYGKATYNAMWEYFHQPGGRRKTTSAPLRPIPKKYIWRVPCSVRCTAISFLEFPIFGHHWPFISWEALLSRNCRSVVLLVSRVLRSKVEKPVYMGIIINRCMDPY